jgi:4-hydroxy-4-methyl-2-oxoglutarate aldolase
MPTVHPPELLDELRQWNTPTIANAIELFNVVPRNRGFMNPDIKCIFPEMGVMVGYAVTVRIEADQPAAPGRTVNLGDYFDYIMATPAPRIVVVQDLDQPPAVGSLWGEVNGNRHKAMGCLGTITNGGVRDIDEVREIGFQFFASAVIPSHAFVHLVDFGTPVKVGGLVVNSGDLLHADKHGVMHIPHELAAGVPDKCREMERRERPLIELSKSPDFTVEKLKELMGLVRKEQTY